MVTPLAANALVRALFRVVRRYPVTGFTRAGARGKAWRYDPAVQPSSASDSLGRYYVDSTESGIPSTTIRFLLLASVGDGGHLVGWVDVIEQVPPRDSLLSLVIADATGAPPYAAPVQRTGAAGAAIAVKATVTPATVRLAGGCDQSVGRACGRPMVPMGGHSRARQLR